MRIILISGYTSSILCEVKKCVLVYLRISSILLKIKCIKEPWESHDELGATDDRPCRSPLTLKHINDKTSPGVCSQHDQLVSVLTRSHKVNLPFFAKQTCSTLAGLQKVTEQLLLWP